MDFLDLICYVSMPVVVWLGISITLKKVFKVESDKSLIGGLAILIVIAYFLIIIAVTN